MLTENLLIADLIGYSVFSVVFVIVVVCLFLRRGRGAAKKLTSPALTVGLIGDKAERHIIPKG